MNEGKYKLSFGLPAHFEQFHEDNTIKDLNSLAIKAYDESDYESSVVLWAFLSAHLHLSLLQSSLFLSSEWNDKAAIKQFVYFTWNLLASYCNYKAENYATVVSCFLCRIYTYDEEILQPFQNERVILISKLLALFKPCDNLSDFDKVLKGKKLALGSLQALKVLASHRQKSNQFVALNKISLGVFASLCCYVFSIFFHEMPKMQDYTAVFSDSSEDDKAEKKFAERDTYHLVSCAKGIASCIFSSVDRTKSGTISILNRHAIQAYRSQDYALAIVLGSFLLIQERVTEKYLTRNNTFNPDIGISRANQVSLAWSLGNAHYKNGDQAIAIYLLEQVVKLDPSPERKSQVEGRLQEWEKSLLETAADASSIFFERQENLTSSNLTSSNRGNNFSLNSI